MGCRLNPIQPILNSKKGEAHASPFCIFGKTSLFLHMRHCLLVFFLTTLAVSTYAQQADYVNLSQEFPDTINRPRLRKLLWSEAGIYTIGLSYMSFVWYKDSESVPFHFFNDNAEYLGMDKMSHAFACYHLGMKNYYLLRSTGVSKKNALLGGAIGFLLWTPIEVFDGLFDSYGFSKGDVVANFAGSALFVAQQALFDEQVIKMKFSFWPTDYKLYAPKYQQRGHLSIGAHIFDYNAQTWWFSMNVSKIIRPAPKWLCLSFGVGAKGMVDRFDNPTVGINGQALPQFERYRQYLFSIDVDLTKIKTRSRFLKKVFNELNILKIPAPTLEYNQLNGWKFRPLYW